MGSCTNCTFWGIIRNKLRDNFFSCVKKRLTSIEKKLPRVQKRRKRGRVLCQQVSAEERVGFMEQVRLYLHYKTNKGSWLRFLLLLRLLKIAFNETDCEMGRGEEEKGGEGEAASDLMMMLAWRELREGGMRQN